MNIHSFAFVIYMKLVQGKSSYSPFSFFDTNVDTAAHTSLNY